MNYILKPTLLVFLFILTNYYLIGQETINLGLKLGSNLSTRIRNTEGSFKYTPGISFHGGSFIQVPLSEKLALQPEILYSSRTFYSKIDLEDFLNAQPSASNNEYVALIKDNYLSVPLCLNVGLNEKWVLQVGPEFGFLLNTVTKDKSKNENPNTADVSHKGNFRVDLGPLVGIMFQLNERLSFQGRGYFGLGELLRKTEFEKRSGTKDNWHDLIFQLSIGYTLF